MFSFEAQESWVSLELENMSENTLLTLISTTCKY